MLRSLKLIVFLTLLSFAVSTGAQQSQLDIERIQRSTVFVIQTRSSDLTMTCVGSGTIVRYDGLILTNAHNVLQSSTCPGDTLIIAMTLDLEEPPIPRYRAEIAGADAGLDLALLRITREFDGRLIEPGTLPVLPFVELADVSEVRLDNTISMIGYPSLGDEPIASFTASVTGFLDEPGTADIAWIKMTAIDPVPGTVSGGGAYDSQGRLIGIPTTAPAGRDQTAGNCPIIEDTNGDGFINNNDSCVPLGDFISVLRPVDFARPLIRRGSLQLSVETLTSPDFQVTPDGPPTFSRLYFSPAVVDDLPSSVIGSAPAGIDSLYLFFDYDNMTPETVYEMRVNVDGVPVQTFSLPPVRWSGGERGLWYIGISNQPFPNGIYEYRLLINGVAVASQEIVVGGPAQNNPDFSNVVFGLLDEEGRNLEGNGYVLPTGTIATARFIYQNMEPGITWTAVWSYNGTQIVRTDQAWNTDDGASGVYPISLQPQGGLAPGVYRLDLYINALLTATGDFTISGQQRGALPDVFTGITFIRADTVTDIDRTTPASTYPDGADTLFARFDWQQIAPGTPWTLRWLVDDAIFYERTLPWTASESGADFTVRLSAPDGLPSGSYRLELLIDNILMSRADVSVGIGQLPIDELAQPGGLLLRGQVIDSETGRGIPGATFVLITEDFSVADFVWDEEQIYARAVTDRNGNFEIDRPLQTGSPYSAIVAVEGYLPVAGDGLEYSEEDGNTIEMTIPLVRD